MPRENERICTRGKIWELHIHSNQCFSADKELKKLSIPEYVTAIQAVLEEYGDLEMISFTDHNQICFDLYKEFINRGSRFTLLPGIEIDTSLVPDGEKKDSKHIVVYFDAADNLDRLEMIARVINQLMVSKNVGVQSGQRPIYIHELLDRLATLEVQFILSPHAMKQQKRDIDADWHSMEDAERAGTMKKYLDQFFCFWEASGTSQIHHAAQFLRDMDCGERISVVAFSDSKDFDKLRKYLDKPCQYFNALPSFDGLKMAGSEITRITREQYHNDSAELGSYIGTVLFCGQEIKLSPRLNAIIGGRGSGKSVLLDSLANGLGLPGGRLEKKRTDFIGKLPISLSSMSGVPISAGQFHFDYYNQSYISKLFEKQGDDFNKELESYFSSAFERIEPLETSAIKRSNEENFESNLESFQSQDHDNLEGFVEKYIVDNKDTLSIAIRDKDRKKLDAKLASFSYEDSLAALAKVIKPKIPPFLREDKAVEEAANNLYRVICERAYAKRMQYLESAFFFNAIIDTFKAKKASISKAQKDRSEAKTLFRTIFEEKGIGYRRRVSLVNAFVRACDGFQTHYENSLHARGERERAFLFKRELDIEHPLDYMARLFSEQISSRGLGACEHSNLWAYIQAFCFNEDCYKQGYNAETLFDALSKYDLRYEERLSISYLRNDGGYDDISTLSPGTQTNILLEYIVHQETKKPLLIDQPEDNVDNQTIYSDIKRWFMKMKHMRQVIVVTHDANIVINADADNVIIASQDKNGSFTYKYGALEYDDTLEDASLILDGGKEAVKRRLLKYGE